MSLLEQLEKALKVCRDAQNSLISVREYSKEYLVYQDFLLALVSLGFENITNQFQDKDLHQHMKYAINQIERDIQNLKNDP